MFAGESYKNQVNYFESFNFFNLFYNVYTVVKWMVDNILLI